MKKLICVISVICLITPSTRGQERGNSLEFIENRGQIVDMEGNLRPDILYVGDGGGAKIYLRQGGVSYVMDNGQLIIDNEEEEELPIDNEQLTIDNDKEEELGTLRVHRVDMEFVNANTDAKIRVENPTEGYFNYYLGHCPDGITGIKAHRKVIYENVYPDIDVIFYGGKAKGMEYDFVVKPGGSVEDIKLTWLHRIKILDSWFLITYLCINQPAVARILRSWGCRKCLGNGKLEKLSS